MYNFTAQVFLLECIVLWSPHWRNTKNWKQYWISSMLQSTFHQKHWAFFSYRSQSATYFYNSTLRKTWWFWALRHKIQNFQKLISSLIYLDIRSHYSQQLKVWLPPSAYPIQTSKMLIGFWSRNQFFWFFCQTPDRRKFPKKRCRCRFSSIFNFNFLKNCRFDSFQTLALFLKVQTRRKCSCIDDLFLEDIGRS